MQTKGLLALASAFIGAGLGTATSAESYAFAKQLTGMQFSGRRSKARIPSPKRVPQHYTPKLFKERLHP